MKIIYRRQHETISNLAFEFGVSERTIRRDIEILSLTEPIYTKTGRYGGGVYILNNTPPNREYFNDGKLQLLKKFYSLAKKKAKCSLLEDELHELEEMIEIYSKRRK